MLGAHSFGTIMIMLVSFCVLVVPTSAQGFLNFEQTESSKDFDMRGEVQDSLMKELAANFRPGATQNHIISLEAQLKPLFATAPQNKDKTISQKVVRYLLHRFFLQRGWFIQGLQPWATTPESPHFGAPVNHTNHDVQAAKKWVPNYLHEFLEQWHGDRGTTLRELAVFAATVENLAHKEAFWSLDKVLSAVTKRPKRFNEAAVNAVIGRLSIMDVRNARNFMSWNNLEQWTQSVIQEVVIPRETTGPVNVTVLGNIVEEIWNRYGSYHQKECADLKSQFLRYESRKAGRMRLADFYDKGRTVDEQAHYRIDYLRDLGVMDESNPEEPLVIVANYVGSRPNCKTVSGFHAMCCRNECEDLLQKLEGNIRESSGSPDTILALVAATSSDTVVAPRKLSSTLSEHLHKIAASSGGQVPLHGRLFAQWMHHAFPRECPFPSITHTSTAETPEEWKQKTGVSSRLSKAEQRAQMQAAKVSPDLNEDSELPWTDVEELLIRGSTQTAGQASAVMRRVFTFGALAAMAWVAKSLVSGEKGSWLDDSSSKLV